MLTVQSCLERIKIKKCRRNHMQSAIKIVLQFGKMNKHQFSLSMSTFKWPSMRNIIDQNQVLKTLDLIVYCLTFILQKCDTKSYREIGLNTISSLHISKVVLEPYEYIRLGLYNAYKQKKEHQGQFETHNCILRINKSRLNSYKYNNDRNLECRLGIVNTK